MIQSPDIVKSELWHIQYVGERMREADRQEIIAMGGDPVESLIATFHVSVFAWTWFADGIPAAVFGLSCKSWFSDNGTPWMITTPQVTTKRTQFLRFCKRTMRSHYGNYRHLENIIDDRHEVAKRWLTWLGFEMGEPFPFGPQNLPFRKFEMRRG